MKRKWAAVLVLLLTFGGIYLADMLGYWQTTSNQDLLLVGEGDEVGLADPEAIRGSTTFLDIEQSFLIPSATLATAFNLPSENPGSLKAMDVSEFYEVLGEEVELGTGSVKLFVALYTDVPHGELENLPSTAVDVLKENGRWSESLEEEISAYIIEVNPISSVEDESDEGLVVSEENESSVLPSALEIAGQTTVKDVVDAGVPLETVEDILGIKVDQVNLSIKTIAEQNDLSFGTVKEALQAVLP